MPVSSAVGRGDNSGTLIKKVLILVHVRLSSPNIHGYVGLHAKLRKRPNPSTSQLAGNHHLLMLVVKDPRRHLVKNEARLFYVGYVQGWAIRLPSGSLKGCYWEVSGVTHRSCCPCWNRKGSMPEAGEVTLADHPRTCPRHHSHLHFQPHLINTLLHGSFTASSSVIVSS